MDPVVFGTVALVFSLASCMVSTVLLACWACRLPPPPPSLETSEPGMTRW